MEKLFGKNLCKNWTAKITYHPSCYIICLTFIFVLLIPSTSQGKSKGRFFLGVGGTQVQIGGSFDGTGSVADGGSSKVLPDLDTANGIKLIAGYQSDKGAFELSYNRSKHDGTWLGLDMPSEFKSYNLDFKIFVFKEIINRIQPLLALGVASITLTVEGGSTDGFSTADAKFKGFALRYGGGIEISLHEHIAIGLLGIYRRGSYNSGSGIVSGSIEDIDGDGFTGSVEVKYIF